MDDIILYWNKVALEANRESHTAADGEQKGPVLSSRALAIVHLAMFEAYFGTDGIGVLPHYLSTLGNAVPGASMRAAVSMAAFDTLKTLYNNQIATLQLAFDAVDQSPGNIADGRAYGSDVATAILLDRGGDPPGGKDPAYVFSTKRGHHRPDPSDPTQEALAPAYGELSRNFAVTARHGLAAPPALTTSEYRRALREVRGKGIAPSLAGTLPGAFEKRTSDETVVGVFWGYDGASKLGTPPRLYNLIVREVAVKRGNDEAKNAHLFALVNAAMADAGILAWEQKYRWDLWRPVVGIRENDPSLGPDANVGTDEINTDTQVDWLPLGAPNSNVIGKNTTPNFPAYPSGHATFGAAALQTVRRFYKPKIANGPDDLFDDLTFVSEEHNGETSDNVGTVRPRHVRSFPDGLWQMIIENGRSRVHLGVHWVFDAFATKSPHKVNGTPDLARDVGGVVLGLKIANDLATNGLKRSSIVAT